MRDLFLRGLLLTLATAAFLTELLSLFHLLVRWLLIPCWLVIVSVLWRRPAACAWRSTWPAKDRPAMPLGILLITAAILPITACTVLTAWLAPPNSADAMAYHMPRVIYWAQSASVAFFPTPYFNQITLSPLAEYLMLHSYILTGGDHFINLLTCFAFLAGIIAVSALAGALGHGRNGQALAALFCATLPNGILQASGAKNDTLLALCLVLMLYFALRRDAPLAGIALGLAFATKATAYLFAPPLLAAAMLLPVPIKRWELRRALVWLAAGVLLINTPQYIRNLRLSGSPIGYDSAQGDGFFRWRNEHPGWRSTISNALRHASDQLGGRSPHWNQAVYDAVLRIHRALGLDPQDPATTWRWSRYEPPRNANHEANANNRWHLLATAVVLAAWRRDRRCLLYAAALLAAWVLFCFYLKWQPYLARLELPLFVLAAPLGAWLLDAIRPCAAAVLVCLFLLAGARLPATENWTRPLRGPQSLFHTARDANYFNDMGQWNNRASYLESVDLAAGSDCALIGIDISENQLEYPFQALLRERRPEVRFIHTGVKNASARYYPVPLPRPCAIWCPDCDGNAKKLELYRACGAPLVVGRFLYWPPRSAASPR